MASPNQRVGEYVLQERIAAGTFGEVWRASHHVWSDQLVAVKIPTDQQYLRSLQHEGLTIHGLHHTNIVRAIGFDPYGDPPYLAMEFVPGTSLRPLIANKRLKVEDVVAVMRQVLAALGHAHKQNIVHRDVKPENVLIHERAFKDGFEADGVVKVTDFGCGKSSASTAGSIVLSAPDTPEAREIAGTLDYMAPEQRSTGDVDGRSDLYSCGVMLYEMLTGERPAGTDVPSDLNPAVPKYLDDAFRRSYARLDKRFTSAEEFAGALVPPLRSIPPLPRTGIPPALNLKPTTRVPPITKTPPAIRGGRSSCPQCHGAVEPNDQFCMHCGVQLVENVRRCPQCGAYPDPTDQFCIFCGQVLAAEPSRAV